MKLAHAGGMIAAGGSSVVFTERGTFTVDEAEEFLQVSPEALRAWPRRSARRAPASRPMWLASRNARTDWRSHRRR
jgi:hypothetical protein